MFGLTVRRVVSIGVWNVWRDFTHRVEQLLGVIAKAVERRLSLLSGLVALEGPVGEVVSNNANH